MRTMRTLHACRGAFAIAFIVSQVVGGVLLHAATVQIGASADTTLHSAFPDNNLGAGTGLWAGGRRQGGAARSLLQFDIAGSIPAGATINSVTLSLNVVGTPAGGVDSLFNVHRILVSWGEGNNPDASGGSLADVGESSWNSRFAPGTAWTTPGGDFNASASANQFVSGNGAYTFASTASLVSDVQSWLDTPANNFGWEIVSQAENTPASIRRFGSRDSGLTAPMLSVDFTPVPEPATWMFMGLGAAALCCLRLRRYSKK